MSMDHQQDALLSNSQQDVASNVAVEVRGVPSNPAPGPRSRSWARGLLYTGVSILVAMLIAGQVASIMFLLKQQDKITNLQKTTKRIESKYSAHRGPVKPMMHLRPIMMNMPVAYINPEAEAPKEGNKSEEIPEMGDSLSNNLKLVKQSLNVSDWEDFESWLQNWLLFQLVQNKKEEAPTSAPHVQPWRDPKPSGRNLFSNMAKQPMMQAKEKLDEAAGEPKKPLVMPGIKIQRAETLCERKRKMVKRKPGSFYPSCNTDGNFEPKQCWPSTGFCWCSYPNGTEVKGTATRDHLDNCESRLQLHSPAYID
ncbi:H-2 class II histocompatibility antigen gamma chain-like isoform X2 [Narcine bancroftii]|uniref:H-2 class II histocompatibility antigen gamma chain-like isoform X2 n=1 Tax=Narcine bancroftii TaxID=1343680 RepID=UPI003831F0B7